MSNRIGDWLHEIRIARIVRALRAKEGTAEYMRIFDQLRDAINQRSAAQVERMERARGLR